MKFDEDNISANKEFDDIRIRDYADGKRRIIIKNEDGVGKEVKIPIPSKNKAVFKKKEIDNTMWINYSYHCEKISKLEEEIRTLRGIALLILELNGI